MIFGSGMSIEEKKEIGEEVEKKVKEKEIWTIDIKEYSLQLFILTKMGLE